MSDCDHQGKLLTNPWLADDSPKQELPRPVLEERILSLLSSHNMAVVATINDDGSPAATPVRYYSLGFEIFYTSWNASQKSRNLRRDPRVSAGIFAPLVGQANSRGAQLFGKARTLERDDPRPIAIEKHSVGNQIMWSTVDPSTSARRIRSQSSHPAASSTPNTGSVAKGSAHAKHGEHTRLPDLPEGLTTN